MSLEDARMYSVFLIMAVEPWYSTFIIYVTRCNLVVPLITPNLTNNLINENICCSLYIYSSICKYQTCNWITFPTRRRLRLNIIIEDFDCSSRCVQEKTCQELIWFSHEFKSFTTIITYMIILISTVSVQQRNFRFLETQSELNSSWVGR